MTDHHAPLCVDLPDGRSYTLAFEAFGAVPARLEAVGLRRGRCLVVTDTNVLPLYGAALEEPLTEAGWTPKTIVVPAGEPAKSAAVLQQLYDEALAWGMDRKTPVLALGGGVVGDLAGYAAATLLRGLPLVQLPTTLVAQVDSAIGGKTGINHAAGKNLIGAFHQPRLVAIDRTTLTTLPEREWTSGLAEVVKHALIADADFFDFLEANWGHVLAREPETVATMVHRAAAIKVAVVSEDEREQGRRAILNFGHTFGHAIERVAGYGTFTHGEAVAVGMQAALALSGRLFPEVPVERSLRLVRRIPVAGSVAALSTNALIAAMQADKKTEAGMLRLVVLRQLGEAVVTSEASHEEVEAAWTFVQA